MKSRERVNSLYQRLQYEETLRHRDLKVPDVNKETDELLYQLDNTLEIVKARDATIEKMKADHENEINELNKEIVKAKKGYLEALQKQKEQVVEIEVQNAALATA